MNNYKENLLLQCVDVVEPEQLDRENVSRLQHQRIENLKTNDKFLDEIRGLKQKFKDKEGRLHRKSGPVEIFLNGTEKWYHHGKLHRKGGPAVIYGPEKENQISAGCRYYINGELHREDGPAVIYPDFRKWYLYGLLHRDEGPAIECNSGYVEYWFEGKKYSKEEHKLIVSKVEGEILAAIGRMQKQFKFTKTPMNNFKGKGK